MVSAIERFHCILKFDINLVLEEKYRNKHNLSIVEVDFTKVLSILEPQIETRHACEKKIYMIINI